MTTKCTAQSEAKCTSFQSNLFQHSYSYTHARQDSKPKGGGGENNSDTDLSHQKVGTSPADSDQSKTYLNDCYFNFSHQAVSAYTFHCKSNCVEQFVFGKPCLHCTCAEETWFQDLMVSETTRCTKTMNPWHSKLKVAHKQCLIFHFCSSAQGRTGCIFGHTVNLTGAQICQWAGIQFPCPCLTPVTHEILLVRQ